jgi:hypothetical protein
MATNCIYVIRNSLCNFRTYLAEAHLTDNVAGDGLPNAREEYPECNQ